TYYFPRLERDHVRYFQLLADRSPLPVFVYNMPACVGVKLSVEAVQKCTPHRNIIGLKDSGGDLAAFRQFLTLRDQRPDWSFLIGPEHLLADGVLAGGDGGVHAGANLCPELFVNWYHAADRGDQTEIARLREIVHQLGRIYEVGDDFLSVARGIKCALSLRGICSDVMAEPATAYEDEQRLLIRQFVEELLMTGVLSAESQTR
ncbi:MAG TPA: dihydrodipicolinate synthase family protein, partial [Planctomycetaceae bacterium]|nr:dihydrodipicolinate synthase family protein [Planctomycetaceae bacterium]